MEHEPRQKKTAKPLKLETNNAKIEDTSIGLQNDEKIWQSALLKEHNTCNMLLRPLVHEITRNGYLLRMERHIVLRKTPEHNREEHKLKRALKYHPDDPWSLDLNREELTILQDVDHKFHCKQHARLGYPLSKDKILALYL